MHELSIASAILATVERHAAGRRVTVVSLRVGELRQVVPDTLAFYWEMVARGSLCEGARLEIRRWCGRACAAAVRRRVGDERGRLPLRGVRRRAAAVVAGQELEVESIEVEEGASCTAPA